VFGGELSSELLVIVNDAIMGNRNKFQTIEMWMGVGNGNPTVSCPAYTAIPFYFFKLANSFFQVQITVENGGNAS
jgi:hypothetical protein